MNYKKKNSVSIWKLYEIQSYINCKTEQFCKKKIIIRDVYCGKGHKNEKINLQDKDNKDEKSLQCMLHGDELLKIATN